jgi:hypothetical protein
MPVVLIVLVGVSGAVVLTGVYATDARTPRFTSARLMLVFAGLLLVTVPAPLIVYFDLERGQSLARRSRRSTSSAS